MTKWREKKKEKNRSNEEGISLFISVLSTSVFFSLLSVSFVFFPPIGYSYLQFPVPTIRTHEQTTIRSDAVALIFRLHVYVSTRMQVSTYAYACALNWQTARMQARAVMTFRPEDISESRDLAWAPIRYSSFFFYVFALWLSLMHSLFSCRQSAMVSSLPNKCWLWLH